MGDSKERPDQRGVSGVPLPVQTFVDGATGRPYYMVVSAPVQAVAVGAAAIAAERERCAELCDEEAEEAGAARPNSAGCARMLAARIRGGALPSIHRRIAEALGMVDGEAWGPQHVASVDEMVAEIKRREARQP